MDYKETSCFTFHVHSAHPELGTQADAAVACDQRIQNRIIGFQSQRLFTQYGVDTSRYARWSSPDRSSRLVYLFGGGSQRWLPRTNAPLDDLIASHVPVERPPGSDCRLFVSVMNSLCYSRVCFRLASQVMAEAAFVSAAKGPGSRGRDTPECSAPGCPCHVAGTRVQAMCVTRHR